MSTPSATSTQPATSTWIVPSALVLLVFIPLAAGMFRLSQLFGGAPLTPENARFFASPVPVTLHIICACVYTLAAPFLFLAGFRRRRPGWHRVLGRVAAPCGLVVALSGLWMTAFYPLPSHDGALLGVFRLLVGSWMAASILLGFAAIRRRDFARHRVWMIRGYAIAVGAGTQVLTILPWTLIVGEPGVFSRAMLMAAAWVINLVVAERIIRRKPTGPPLRPRGSGAMRVPGVSY